MSASKYSFIPSKCNGDFCPGDCDRCPKEFLCPDGMNDDNDCAADLEMCEICWERWKEEQDG